MARSEGFKDVARVCLNVFITALTLIPLIHLAIKDDVEGLILEIVAQAVIVAGILAKVMRIPMIAAWLESWGIGHTPEPVTPTQP